MSKSSTSSPLKLNRTFAKNIIKHTDDNNRITSNIQQTNQRKFVNQERKKHTKLQLSSEGKSTKQGKTMYSDYVTEKLSEKTQKKGIIHPLEQMKKLVKDAAEFDNTMSEKEIQKLSGTFIPSKRPKIILDKTVLHNHLKHTSVHNRLKEEGEMWEKFQVEKKRTKLQSKSLKAPIRRGGMYADSEPGASLTVKLQEKERSIKIERSIKKESRKSLKRTVIRTVTSNQELSRRKVKRPVQTIDIPSSNDESSNQNQPVQGKRKVSRISLKTKEASSHKRNVIIEDVPLKKKKTEPAIVRTYGKLNADMIDERPTSQVSSEKWGHDGFFEQEKTPVKEISIVKRKPITVSDDEANEDDSIHKTKARHILKSSIHVKPAVKEKSVERQTERPKVHRTIQKKPTRETTLVKRKERKQRSQSSSSSSSSSASGSSSSSSSSTDSDSGSSSSLTSSSSDDEDEKPTKRKQTVAKQKKPAVKHRRNKVKNTFSDYDSDFQPRK